MGKERKVDVSKESDNHRIRQFTQIAEEIPADILDKNYKLLMAYFKAQVRISNGQMVRARRLLSHLENHGLLDFEEKHEGILAAIDVAVRGNTNRVAPPDTKIILSFKG